MQAGPSKIGPRTASGNRDSAARGTTPRCQYERTQRFVDHVDLATARDPATVRTIGRSSNYRLRLVIRAFYLTWTLLLLGMKRVTFGGAILAVLFALQYTSYAFLSPRRTGYLCQLVVAYVLIGFALDSWTLRSRGPDAPQQGATD